MTLCAKCGQEVDADDIYQVHGQEMCEDCAISSQNVLKPCDVWAVHNATNTRKRMGQKDSDGLTGRQKAILEFIKSQNGATIQQLKEKLCLDEAELSNDLVVLRHCELGRGFKKGDKIYIVPWDFKESPS